MKPVNASRTAKPSAAIGVATTAQRRRNRVRAEIIEAGLALFEEKGFEQTTVADIVDSVAMSPRTFFRYFKSKDDLAFDWMSWQGEFMEPRLRNRPASESPLQAMEAAFLELAEHHDSRRKDAMRLSRLIFDTPSLGDRFQGEAAKWEGRWVETLTQARPHDAEHLFILRVQVAIAIAAFVVAVRHWISEAKTEATLRSLIFKAFTAFEEGIHVAAVATPRQAASPPTAGAVPPK